jgi:cyclic-di-AMP phosphodiesterase PgpH
MAALPTIPDVAQTPRRQPSPWLMAALLAFIAALILPKNNPFPYSFSTNKTWNYADLRAPFDYEVLRPEAEVTADLAKLNEKTIQYWTLNTEISRQQKRIFQKEFEAQIKTSRHDMGFADLVANQNAYLTFSLGLLDGLFGQGIVDLDTATWRNSLTESIILQKNGAEFQQNLSAMRPIFLAREWLTDTLPFSKLASPELLLPIFEKTLVANTFFNDTLTRQKAQNIRELAQKTGITVRKNEKIVAKNALITPLIFQKLTSLGNRFDAPNPRFQMVGYLGLAGFAAVALALLVLVYFPEKWDDRRQSMLIFGSVLMIILLFSGFAKLGSAVVLATPMLFLLFFLHQFFQKDLVWMAYLLAVLLTGLALNWGFGWCVVQFAGGFTLLLFPRRVISRRGRMIVVGTATGVMTVALLGVILAGKFDRNTSYYQAPVFMWISALVSLTAFPVAGFFRKKLGRSIISTSAEIEMPTNKFLKKSS